MVSELKLSLKEKASNADLAVYQAAVAIAKGMGGRLRVVPVKPEIGLYALEFIPKEAAK